MFLTWMPIYLVNVWGFSLQEMGLYLMLPCLAMPIIANTACGIANGLLEHVVSPSLVRKGFQGVSFASSAVYLPLLSATTSQWLALLYITLRLGAVAVSAAGFLVNHLDIWARSAGLLMGTANTVGTVPGILAPLATGFIIPATGSRDIVFYLATGISGISLVVWLLFASGEQTLE